MACYRLAYAHAKKTCKRPSPGHRRAICLPTAGVFLCPYTLWNTVWPLQANHRSGAEVATCRDRQRSGGSRLHSPSRHLHVKGAFHKAAKQKHNRGKNGQGNIYCTCKSVRDASLTPPPGRLSSTAATATPGAPSGPSCQSELLHCSPSRAAGAA